MNLAPGLVLAPTWQLVLGEQPLVLLGLVSPNVNHEDVDLAHARDPSRLRDLLPRVP